MLNFIILLSFSRLLLSPLSSIAKSSPKLQPQRMKSLREATRTFSITQRSITGKHCLSSNLNSGSSVAEFYLFNFQRFSFLNFKFSILFLIFNLTMSDLSEVVLKNLTTIIIYCLYNWPF